MVWPRKRFNDRNWHRWFAWYPVRIECAYVAGYLHWQWVWWEPVERKVFDGWAGSFNSYRLLNNQSGDCSA